MVTLRERAPWWQRTDDGGVGVELLVGAGGDLAHGHEERVGQAGGLVLPGLAHV